jgi:hypothetical protein
MSSRPHNNPKGWKPCTSGSLQRIRDQLAEKQKREFGPRSLVTAALAGAVLASVVAVVCVSITARNESRGQQIACEDVQAGLRDYLDGTLTRHERQLFDAHFAICEQCRDHLNLGLAARLNRSSDIVLATRTVNIYPQRR